MCFIFNWCLTERTRLRLALNLPSTCSLLSVVYHSHYRCTEINQTRKKSNLSENKQVWFEDLTDKAGQLPLMVLRCFQQQNIDKKKKISSNSLQRWIEKDQNTYKTFKSTIIKYTMRTTLFPRACLMSVKNRSFHSSYVAALQQYSFAVTVLSGPWNQQVCWDESSPAYCQGADVPVCESLHRLTYLERISKKKLHQKFEVARGKSWQRGPASATVIALCSWENISCLHFLV